jgi:hypothetical protein
MPKSVSIALVSCSGPKLRVAAPAWQLYRSQLFRATLALAQRRHDVAYVISAKHELVELDQVIAPYDLTMADIAKEWRTVWGLRVWGSIQNRHLHVDREVYIYAGKDYAQPIRRAGFHQATFHEPLAKMQVGQRLQWLKQQTAAEPERTA